MCHKLRQTFLFHNIFCSCIVELQPKMKRNKTESLKSFAPEKQGNDGCQITATANRYRQGHKDRGGGNIPPPPGSHLVITPSLRQ